MSNGNYENFKHRYGQENGWQYLEHAQKIRNLLHARIRTTISNVVSEEYGQENYDEELGYIGHDYLKLHNIKEGKIKSLDGNHFALSINLINTDEYDQPRFDGHNIDSLKIHMPISVESYNVLSENDDIDAIKSSLFIDRPDFYMLEMGKKMYRLTQFGIVEDVESDEYIDEGLNNITLYLGEHAVGELIDLSCKKSPETEERTLHSEQELELINLLTHTTFKFVPAPFSLKESF